MPSFFARVQFDENKSIVRIIKLDWDEAQDSITDKWKHANGEFYLGEVLENGYAITMQWASMEWLKATADSRLWRWIAEKGQVLSADLATHPQEKRVAKKAIEDIFKNRTN